MWLFPLTLGTVVLITAFGQSRGRWCVALFILIVLALLLLLVYGCVGALAARIAP